MDGPIAACFLDVDGVLVRAELLGDEWCRLIGDVLAPALGGRPAEWGAANRDVFPRLWNELSIWQSSKPSDPADLYRLAASAQITGLCELVGVEAPEPDDCEELMRRVDVYISANHRAVVDGAADVIRRLARRVALHTATGNESWRVEPMFRSMGVTGHFGTLCGPDLIGVRKGAAGFYPRLFERAGVPPAAAVVVDDSAAQLELAAASGALTVHVAGAGATIRWPAADAVISSIHELPGALEELSAAARQR